MSFSKPPAALEPSLLDGQDPALVAVEAVSLAPESMDAMACGNEAMHQPLWNPFKELVAANGPLEPGKVIGSGIATTPLSPFPVPYLTNQCLWPGCKSLQKEFLTSHDLDFHIHTYHMQQCPWPTCNIGKAFRRRSDLLRHMESIHSGTRRYICDFPLCKRNYARSDKLTAHKRSHSNRTSRRPMPDMNTRLFNMRGHAENIDSTHHSSSQALSIPDDEVYEYNNVGPRMQIVCISPEISEAVGRVPLELVIEPLISTPQLAHGESLEQNQCQWRTFGQKTTGVPI